MSTATAVLEEPLTEPSSSESRRSRHPSAATLVMATPAVLLTVTAVLRYVFGRASIDLVVFDQGLWAASRGMKPMVSVIGETLVEDHFGPAIFVFAALYRIVASPIWLIVGQGVAAWAAVRIIARRLGPQIGEMKAAMVAAALLVSPPVAYAMLFDIHSVVFAVPFALAALFALEDGRPWVALAFGLLAALFRVEIGLAVGAAFVVWPGPRRDRLRASAGLWIYLFVAFYFEKALGHDAYWQIHYGHLGPSAGAALADPLRIAGALLSVDSIFKALPWLVSGAFLALRSPRRLIPAVLVALPVLLSDWPGTGSIDVHYGFAPTLLLAAAWVPALRERPDRTRHVVAGCALLTLLLGPVVPAIATDDPLGMFAGKYWTPRSEILCLVRGIPTEAAVSAQTGLPLLAHRQQLYLWPYPFQGTPREILPGEHLAAGDPRLAATVDYLLIKRDQPALVPAGFVADVEGPRYVRFRRESAAESARADCR